MTSPRKRPEHWIFTLARALAGCPVEHDDGGEPPPLGGTPDAAAKACHDFVQRAAAMLQRTCESNYTLEELEADLESSFEAKFGGGCDAADGLRDEKSFREECLPGLDAMMECLADQKAALPAACNDQLQFVTD